MSTFFLYVKMANSTVGPRSHITTCRSWTRATKRGLIYSSFKGSWDFTHFWLPLTSHSVFPEADYLLRGGWGIKRFPQLTPGQAAAVPVAPAPELAPPVEESQDSPNERNGRLRYAIYLLSTSTPPNFTGRIRFLPLAGRDLFLPCQRPGSQAYSLRREREQAACVSARGSPRARRGQPGTEQSWDSWSVLESLRDTLSVWDEQHRESVSNYVIYLLRIRDP